MRLAILICTLPEEYSVTLLKRLTTILNPQLVPGVDLYIHDAGRAMPTGTKRNELIKNTDSDYVVFIDCDDIVSSTYVADLLEGIEHDPDCVTFRGVMTTNAVDKRDFVIRLGERYEERNKVYYRYPNHITCLKRSAISSVKFKDIWIQEDYHFATEIKNRRLLKTEYFIDKQIYHYDYRTNKPKR